MAQKWNLVGQKGLEGTRNPDPNLSDAEAYYLYDDQPGYKDGKPSVKGDNKGVIYTSFGSVVVDAETHNEKADKVGAEKAKATGYEVGSQTKDLSSTSFGEKPESVAKQLKAEATKADIAKITSLPALTNLAKTKRISEGDLARLAYLYGWDMGDVRTAVALGDAEEPTIESGPLGSDYNWWNLLGFNTLEEADSAFGRGEISKADVDRAIQNTKEDVGNVRTTPDYPITLYNGNGDATVVYDEYQAGWARRGGYSFTDKPNSFQVTFRDKYGNEKRVDYREFDKWRDREGWTFVSRNQVNQPTGDTTPEGTDTKEVTGPKEGDTKVENGITYIFQNGEWVVYETPVSDEGPKEGDTKVVDGVTYIFQNGEWVVVEQPPTGGPTGGPTGAGQIVGQTGSTTMNQFNNIPEGAVLVQSDEDRLYLMYTVPGAGNMYKGLPIRMFYEVRHNDLYKAGILTKGSPYEINYYMTEEEIDDFIVAGTTSELPGNDPNTGEAPHPFLTFVDNLTTQAQVAPWLLDKQSISLLAEAALEGREVTEAEWRVTDWYQTHNEAEREWLRLYYADPATATAAKDDYKIQVSRALQAAGVTGGYDSSTGQEKAAPDALVSWIADKWVSGQWSESYTSEQLALFADPFRSGVRDADFTKYVTSAGVQGLERTAEKEDRVRQLYSQWLGPVFGKLTDAEVSERAGRLRNDPDFEASLIEQLKNNRLGLFPQYTNAELSYEDIVTPWRNLTTSVWGEAADETESWWQDMVATNDFTTGTATLRAKGLENNNQQVTIEATQALEAALGEGSVYQNLGANQ